MGEARRHKLAMMRKADLQPPLYCQHCRQRITHVNGVFYVYNGEECDHLDLHYACSKECPDLGGQFAAQLAAFIAEQRADA